MSLKELLENAKPDKAGRTTISQSALKTVWQRHAELTQKPLDEIRDRRAVALSADTKIILG